MKNLILAIESSCDDSSIAIIDKDSFECVFHKKISQELAHSEFGGVVPELAARLHTTALPSILEQCSGYFDRLCAVAVTSEPGLSVSLLGGITMAKVLCASLRLPLIPVNHLVGHIYSLFLTQNARFEMGVLLVSGGHTMLINVDKMGFLEVLASTNDDSFGESFDKVAKMLALARPNGVCVQECARKASEKSLNFPVPLKHSKELAFSFSGLKNAVRLEILRQESQNATPLSNENSVKSLNLSENSSSNKAQNLSKSPNLSKAQKSEIAFAFEEAFFALCGVIVTVCLCVYAVTNIVYEQALRHLIGRVCSLELVSVEHHRVRRCVLHRRPSDNARVGHFDVLRGCERRRNGRIVSTALVVARN